ncbi:MAG: hypothetical protein ACKO5R_00025, partial [Planctomycetaceae bacterium]
DLYEYVNGTWLKETPIPADKSNYGAFIKLDDLSRERIRAIVEQAAAAWPSPRWSTASRRSSVSRATRTSDSAARASRSPCPTWTRRRSSTLACARGPSRRSPRSAPCSPSP